MAEPAPPPPEKLSQTFERADAAKAPLERSSIPEQARTKQLVNDFNGVSNGTVKPKEKLAQTFARADAAKVPLQKPLTPQQARAKELLDVFNGASKAIVKHKAQPQNTRPEPAKPAHAPEASKASGPKITMGGAQQVKQNAFEQKQSNLNNQSLGKSAAAEEARAKALIDEFSRNNPPKSVNLTHEFGKNAVDDRSK